jgi:hypothetical protein
LIGVAKGDALLSVRNFLNGICFAVIISMLDIVLLDPGLRKLRV